VSGGLQVWVAVTVTPGLDLCDNLGVFSGLYAAVARCAVDAEEIGETINEWVQVTQTGGQAFAEAYESRPFDGDGTHRTLWRIERWEVRS